MKETEFKINKKKRNIIIAIVASIVVLAGIITGVVIYNINNKPVETEEPTTETIVVDEPTEESEDTEVEIVEPTEEPAPSEEPEETEEPTEVVKPTEEPAPSEEPTPPAHTHSYSSSVTSNATCTSNGTITYTCSCGDSYTESIPALGHDYREHTETIHHPGEVVFGCKCNDCGIVLTPDEMAAHQDSTCHIGWDGVEITKPDWDEVITKWICSRCGHCK